MEPSDRDLQRIGPFKERFGPESLRSQGWASSGDQTDCPLDTNYHDKKFYVRYRPTIFKKKSATAVLPICRWRYSCPVSLLWLNSDVTVMVECAGTLQMIDALLLAVRLWSLTSGFRRPNPMRRWLRPQTIYWRSVSSVCWKNVSLWESHK